MGKGDEHAYWGDFSVFTNEEGYIKLNSGIYYLYTAVLFGKSPKIDYSVSLYSKNGSANIEEESDKNKFFEILKKNFLNLGENSNNKTVMNKGCKFNSGWFGEYFYLYAENNTELTWKLTINFTNKENLIICDYNKKDKNIIEMEIPKMSKDIGILIKTTRGIKISIKWKISSIFY